MFEELRIIQQVAEKFPGEAAVYETAYREKAWQEAATGSLIPYACAYKLTEIWNEMVYKVFFALFINGSVFPGT